MHAEDNRQEGFQHHQAQVVVDQLEDKVGDLDADADVDDLVGQHLAIKCETKIHKKFTLYPPYCHRKGTNFFDVRKSDMDFGKMLVGG